MSGGSRQRAVVRDWFGKQLYILPVKKQGMILRSQASAGAAIVIFAACGTLFGETQRSRESWAALSKSAETITGRIAMVKPREGIVIVVRTGPSEPPATELSWTESRDPASGGAEKSPMTVTQVPGETDYAFKITSSTLITVDGRRTSLDRLASSPKKNATVRFQARRTGDFAVEIRVGR